MTSIKDKIDENRAHAAPEKGRRSPAGSDYGDEALPRVDPAEPTHGQRDEDGVDSPKREPGAHR